MENLSQETIYSQLRNNLCKSKRVPNADWNAFIEKTKIIQFKENEEIVVPGQLSTHSYFIIKGLMMCSRPHEPKEAVLWFRAENEHAFTIDKLGILGKPATVNEERLITLEDSVVVGISHDDLKTLEESSRKIFDMMYDLFIRTLVTFDSLSKRRMRNPEDYYEWVQQRVSFNLDRVPDAYLALYLGTSVRRLRKVRKMVQQ